MAVYRMEGRMQGFGVNWGAPTHERLAYLKLLFLYRSGIFFTVRYYAFHICDYPFLCLNFSRFKLSERERDSANVSDRLSCTVWKFKTVQRPWSFAVLERPAFLTVS